MSPETLSSLSAILLSLAFSYIPSHYKGYKQFRFFFELLAVFLPLYTHDFLQPVALTALADGSRFLTPTGRRRPVPVRGAVPGAGQRFGGLPAQVINPPRLIRPQAGVVEIPGGQGPVFGLEAERQPLIPAAGEVKKISQRVADALQTAILAGQQARPDSD